MPSKNDFDSEKVKEIKQKLGEPIIPDFSESGHRVRRNLLFFSVIGLVFIIAGNIKGGNISFAGLTFINLSYVQIKAILITVLYYHIFHFFMIAVEHYLKIKLRLTGVKEMMPLYHGSNQSFRSGYMDYPTDPQQSTLYSWWLEQHNIFIRSKSIQTSIDQLKNNTDAGDNNNNIADIKNTLLAINSILSNERIKISLQRFDDSFNNFLKIQKNRWIIIEFGMPLVFGFIIYLILV